MPIENITIWNNTAFQDLTSQIADLNILFQAIGGFIIIYIIFNVINAILNKKKNREIKEINKNLGDIKNLLKRKNERI